MSTSTGKNPGTNGETARSKSSELRDCYYLDGLGENITRNAIQNNRRNKPPIKIL